MRLKWKREWTSISLLFGCVRLLTLGLGAATPPIAAPDWVRNEPIFLAANSLLRNDWFSRQFVNVWMRWDTGWYLKIAAFGYGAQDNSTVFMPVYPLMIRLVSIVFGGNYLLAAIAVASLACWISLILLHGIAMLEGLGGEEASRTMMFLVAFPTAFFLLAGYTEAPFLAPLLASWLFARRRSWVIAGLLATVATLTRMQGVVMTPVLLWAFLAECSGAARLEPASQIRRVVGLLTTRDGRTQLLARLRRPDWLALAGPLLAFVGYNLWLRRAGMTGVIAALQSGWTDKVVMPWSGIALLLQNLIHGQRAFIDFVDLSILVLVLGLCLFGLFRLDPALSIYNWLTLAMIMMGGSTPHLLDSFSRYTLGLFPVFLLLGQARIGRLRVALWIFSALLQVFLLLVFLRWGWVA